MSSPSESVRGRHLEEGRYQWTMGLSKENGLGMEALRTLL